MLRTPVLAGLVLTFSGCMMTRGNGEPDSDVREVEAFHAIDVGGVFQLQAELGADRRVEVRGDSNLLPLVEIESTGGRLRANIKGNIIPDLPLVLIIRTPELREVELGGASRGEVKGVTGENLALEVSGASTLRVSGTVKRLEADVSGASSLESAGVVAETVEIESSGASNAEVTANTALVAEASGASSIIWFGTATQIDRDVSGASSIEHR